MRKAVMIRYYQARLASSSNRLEKLALLNLLDLLA
ncbi:hypothetical protein VIOR3934_19205 [Vibrio orientalis CIP 102891 = ATCC 33934]|uniref:Uncharacterized protein n=1 Tax=Vibrio orientalis CIP 102891 = ATCC 33934 TaxID=675816 RepID=F9SMD1_VIBOR|nr:hypothetical protein VIOR3934_19205 [Vibrio orientalis CIP 102891 = ATCC 33934]